LWKFAFSDNKNHNPMYLVLDKDTIEKEIIPHLPVAERGFKTQAPLYEIVNAVLYKLKTGVQWAGLPVKALFSGRVLHHKTVFGHFRKWCVRGAWRDCWESISWDNHAEIDLSSADLDGSHTPSIKGGESIGYQRRKKRKTTNALYFADRQGLPLAMSEPVSGNHNDLFEVEICFDEILDSLRRSKIPTEGLFLNTDAGFDSASFREMCERNDIIANIPINKRNGGGDRDEYFDEELYKHRYSIDRTNAWMDGFRSLLNRFDTTVSSWKGFNYLAFIVIGLKRFLKLKKSR